MWFLLRMTFWLGVVLVLLPNVGSQPVPKSQVNASEAFWAAKVVVADIQHFCERQREACIVGSQATVTLGQRAQAGAKMLYEFLSEQFGSDEPRPVRTTRSVPVPPPGPSQHTLRPADLMPPWRGPHPTNTPRDKRPEMGRIEFVNFSATD
jgi:Family of unknown function (DUF5330)